MSTDEKKAMGPSGTIAVSAVTALIVGVGLPWWAQMYLNRPQLPEAQGTWVGTLHRTNETIEDWAISLTRQQSGPWVTGEVGSLMFDGMPAAKLGEYEVKRVAGTSAELLVSKVLPLPNDGNSKLIPGEYVVQVEGLRGDQIQIILHQGNAIGHPFTPNWTVLNLSSRVPE